MEETSRKSPAKACFVITGLIILILFFCAWIGEYGALAANNGWRMHGKELPGPTEDAINFYRHQLHWVYAGIVAVISIGLTLFRRPRIALGVAVTGALLWLLLSTALLTSLSLPGACLCDAWMHWDTGHECAAHKK